MRKQKYTTKFKKDLKRQQKRGKNLESLKYIIGALCNTGEAPQTCRPHKLSGNWAGYSECHVESDWLLIFTVEEETVTLYRTGTHSDLFG